MDGPKRFFFLTDSIELKTEDGKEYITGYASTRDKDLVNDIVTPNCMTDMLAQFNERNMKCDIEHESLRGTDDTNRALNITKIPLARSVKASYDGKGLEVKWEMNPDYKRFDDGGNVTLTYDEVRRMVKSKFLNAFSIAYVPLETARKVVNGIPARLLEKVNVLNTALTGNAINPSAVMTSVMLKSIDSVEDIDDDHVPEKSGPGNPGLKDIGRPNMVDKKDTKPEDKKVEAKSEEQVQDPNAEILASLKSLAERIAALEGTKGAEAGKPENTEVGKLQSDLKALNDKVEKILSTPEYKAISQDMRVALNGEATRKAPEKKSATKGPIDCIS